MLYVKTDFWVPISFSLIKTVHLIPILPYFAPFLSFDIYPKMPKNGIFWHFQINVKWQKWRKVWQYGYQMNRFDQTNWYKNSKIWKPYKCNFWLGTFPLFGPWVPESVFKNFSSLNLSIGRKAKLLFFRSRSLKHVL